MCIETAVNDEENLIHMRVCENFHVYISIIINIFIEYPMERLSLLSMSKVI